MEFSFVEPIVDAELESLLQQVDTVMINHTASNNSHAKRSRHVNDGLGALYQQLQQKGYV